MAAAAKFSFSTFEIWLPCKNLLLQIEKNGLSALQFFSAVRQQRSNNCQFYSHGKSTKSRKIQTFWYFTNFQKTCIWTEKTNSAPYLNWFFFESWGVKGVEKWWPFPVGFVGRFEAIFNNLLISAFWLLLELGHLFEPWRVRKLKSVIDSEWKQLWQMKEKRVKESDRGEWARATTFYRGANWEWQEFALNLTICSATVWSVSINSNVSLLCLLMPQALFKMQVLFDTGQK